MRSLVVVLALALVAFPASVRAEPTATCRLLAHNPLIVPSESRAIYAVWNDSTCAAKIPTGEHPLARLRPSPSESKLPRSLELYAQVTYRAGASVVLNVRDVPRDLPLVSATFDVSFEQTVAGTLTVSLQAIRAQRSIDIQVEPPKAVAVQDDRALAPPAGAVPEFQRTAAEGGLAPARVSPSDEAKYGVVWNRVGVEFPDAFIERTDTAGSLAWFVEYSTWGSNALFRGCVARDAVEATRSLSELDRQLADERSAAAENCYLGTLGSFTFRTHSRTKTPLRVKVALIRFGTNGQSGLNRDALWTGTIDLVNGAVGSEPLPVVGSLALRCGDEGTVGHGRVLAIRDTSVRDGECRLELLPSATPEKVIETYGEQLVRVTVHRDGTKDPPAQDWLLTEQSLRAGFTLPAAEDDTAGRGRYEITVTVLATSVGAVLYEHPVASNGERRDTSLQFRASLTPRGPFGFGGQKSVRMFFTVPVDIVAARTPASPRDLRSSSDNTLVQPIFIKTGLLLALEPWDYRFGRNLSPLPFRIATGIHLVGVGTTSSGFLPSFIAGGYFTLPLIESVSQVNTSLAIGVLYELDLRDLRSYALFTLGFNVFSFLGANR